MEDILGLLFVVYMIVSFISAMVKRAQRPPVDDSWPHEWNEAPEARTEEAGAPQRPGPTGWETLFDREELGAEPEPRRPEVVVATRSQSSTERPSLQAEEIAAPEWAISEPKRKETQRPRPSPRGLQPRPGPSAPSSSQAERIRQRLMDRTSLRDAILLTEVLGPPRSVRPRPTKTR